MPFSIQWESKYSIHNAGIDAEHQTLFALANDILAIEEPQRFKTDVEKLFSYMEFHFRHEEELMKKVRYPGREIHAVQHGEIVAQMNGLLRDCGSLREVAQRLRHLLLDWPVKPVAEEDAKITSSVDRFAMTGAC